MTHLNAEEIRDRLYALSPLSGSPSLAGSESASLPTLRFLAREIGTLSNNKPRDAASCLIEFDECLYSQDRDAVLSVVGALVEAASTSDDPVLWAWVWGPAVDTWDLSAGKSNLVWALINNESAHARQCGLETLMTLLRGDDRLVNETLVRDMVAHLCNDPVAILRDVARAWSQSIAATPKSGPAA